MKVKSALLLLLGASQAVSIGRPGEIFNVGLAEEPQKKTCEKTDKQSQETDSSNDQLTCQTGMTHLANIYQTWYKAMSAKEELFAKNEAESSTSKEADKWERLLKEVQIVKTEWPDVNYCKKDSDCTHFMNKYWNFFYHETDCM